MEAAFYTVVVFWWNRVQVVKTSSSMKYLTRFLTAYSVSLSIHAEVEARTRLLYSRSHDTRQNSLGLIATIE